VDNALDALGPIAGRCAARCDFCFEHGVPFPRDESLLCQSEAATRLRHFDKARGLGLFPSARPHMEPFTNPAALAILEACRRADPTQLLVVTTNGFRLDEDAAHRIAALRPVLVKLSLNFVDPATRLRVMGRGSRPDVAIGAADRLRRAGVPFIGSVVLQPNIPRHRLEETIRFLVERDAYGVRVRLPIHHRFMHPEGSATADWDEMLAWVERIAASTRCPVWAEPTQAWLPPLVARVDGVVCGSPAEAAGIRAGDRVCRIGPQPIAFREELRGFLADTAEPCLPLSIHLQRDGATVETTITRTHVASARYPYTPLGHPSERLGLIALPDVSFEQIRAIAQAIVTNNARRTVVFTSPLCTPVVRRLLFEHPAFVDALAGRDVVVADVDEPWMGGNSHLLESRLVADYERAVARLLRNGALEGPPDLLVLPDSFGSDWGIDLQGRSLEELSHRTGVRVARVPWALVYGRED
jgi:molybdenum cofactor biosynthesis enzyme MoaA